MSWSRARGVWLSLSGLLGCGGSGTVVVLGDLPADVQSTVVAFEQDELKALFVEAASAAVTEIELPAGFSESEPIDLTRLAFREALTDFGVSKAGALPESSEPRRPLSTLEARSTAVATLSPGLEEVRLAEGTASAWIQEYPVPRPDRCIKSARIEPAYSPSSPMDLLSVRSDLAVGITAAELVSFREDSTVARFPLPVGETGRRVGLGVGGRVLVATNRTISVWDETSGSLSDRAILPADIEVSGIAEDPETGTLFVLTSSAALWRFRSLQRGFELLFETPQDRVRYPGFNKHAGRFHFQGSGRFVVAARSLIVLLEVNDDRVTMLAGAAIGTGFGNSVETATGRLLLAESARGDLYEYQTGRLVPVGTVPTLIVGLLPLDDDGQHLLYLGSSALVGTVDESSPTPCPEIAVPNLDGPDGLVRVGERYVVWGALARSLYGFGWLDLGN